MGDDIAIAVSSPRVESIESKGQSVVEPRKRGATKARDTHATQPRNMVEHILMRCGHEERQRRAARAKTSPGSRQHLCRLEIVGVDQALDEAVKRLLVAK